ncbi:hypothetical protein IAT38_000772 [Cryptococcus sp. DSM 104549]
MINPSPIASSSRHTLSAPPLSPPPLSKSSPRSSRRRRLAHATVFLVLSLTLPFVSANPIPYGEPHHRARLRPAPSPSPPLHSFSLATSARHLFTSALHTVSRRGNATEPILAITSYDTTLQAYRLPDNYCKLDQHFNAGFIVLSYLIAFVGSLCTLELLIRRTTNSGWRNQVLLAAAGVCFGAVSTFAMHFVFNNALALRHPIHEEYPEVYLAYNAGFTVLSLVVSCLAMTFAFFVMGTKMKDWRFMFIGEKRRKREEAAARERRRALAAAERERLGEGAEMDSPGKNEGDDYHAWKSTHKRVLRRGTIGVGALLSNSGNSGNAKWSHLDAEETGSRPGSRTGSRNTSLLRDKLSFGSRHKPAWKEEVSDFYGHDGEDGLDDKALAELQFRLGKTAVKHELERRAHTGSPLHDARESHSGRPSRTNSVVAPPHAFYPPSRRSSIASIMHHDSASNNNGNGVFAANFNFPPRASTVPAPTFAFPAPAPSHATSTTQTASSPSDDVPPRSESPFSEPFQHPPIEWRRASLPTNILIPHRNDRPSYSGPSTLARIQSLPEGDLDPGSTSSSRGSRGSAEEDAMEPHSPQERSDSVGSSQGTKQDGSLDEGISELPHGEKVERKKRRVKLVGAGTKMEKVGHFLGFDVVTTSEIVKIFVTGITAGFGVVGMHYIGQASIVGIPYIAYRPEYVVGSIIIACGAVVIALYIMFIMLRPKLKHTWWSKICVALILSVAVCMMHFCGMMGTIYAWPINKGTNKHAQLTGTNVAITGVVAALAFTACIACAVFFILHSIHQRREQARRRRVVVAAVLMDERDRVLVNSTDGMLPMCDIASLTGGGGDSKRAGSFMQSMSSDSTVLGMDLSTGHDAFVSALKLSWTWRHPALSHMHPVMPFDRNSQGTAVTGATAGSVTTNQTQGPGQADSTLAMTLAEIRRASQLTANTVTTATGGHQPVPISITKFLEKFATSSGQLAMRLTGQMNGITRLGVLYDQILTTGWVKLQNSNDTVSKGQLLFLVRRVTSAAERFDLESRHYIFADPSSVATALHRTLSVPFDHTLPLLDDIRTFCDSSVQCTLQPGRLYAGVAVVQATPFDGLRILLERNRRSQLPMREVCQLNGGQVGTSSQIHEDHLGGTVEEIGEALSMLQGVNMLGVITRNVMTGDTGADEALSKRVAALLGALERAIVPMLDEMLTAEDMSHILPRLTLHPLLIPLTPGGRPAPPLPQPFNLGNPPRRMAYTPPYAIVFYANYDAAVNTFTDKWLPFSLFRAQNACVMAQRVQLGMRMERLWAEVGDDDAGMPNMGRRPSKVQFDFPAQVAMHNAQMHGQHIPSAPGSASGHAFDDTIFEGYSFPPKTDEPSSISGGSGSGSSSSLQRQSSLKTSSAAGAGSGAGVARRSSLARSRFNSVGGESIAPSAEGASATGPTGLGIASGPELPGLGHFTGIGGMGGMPSTVAREMTMRQTWPGVGVWDQDWLLNLLRSKLRAEA